MSLVARPGADDGLDGAPMRADLTLTAFTPESRAPRSSSPAQRAAGQRRRLMEATIELIGTQGYSATTVSELLEHAGVSHKAFYRDFKDKRECFLAAYDTIVAEGIERVTSASEADGAGEVPGSGLEALFEHAIENPSFPRLVHVEIRATGPEGIARREQLLGAYERLVRGGLELPPGSGTIPNPLARAFVGGFMKLLSTRARKNARTLRPLLPELTRWSAAYYPAPAAVKRALCNPPPAPAPTGLVGGRAPGTLRRPSTATAGARGSGSAAKGVSRSLIVHCQRELVLDAVTNLSSAKGYANLSLEHIVREAGVPLSAFYAHFDGKEDAFLVAHEVGQSKARAIAERAAASRSDWPAGVRAGIEALLEFLATEPAFAQLALAEALIATARSAQRANLAVGALAGMLTPGLDQDAGDPRYSAATIEAIAGGIFELCLTYAVRDRIAELPELVPAATYFALAPFIGRERAGRVATAPAPG